MVPFFLFFPFFSLFCSWDGFEIRRMSFSPPPFKTRLDWTDPFFFFSSTYFLAAEGIGYAENELFSPLGWGREGGIGAFPFLFFFSK